MRAIKRDAGESLGAESADGVVRRVGRAGARRDRQRSRAAGLAGSGAGADETAGQQWGSSERREGACLVGRQVKEGGLGSRDVEE